MFWSRRAMTRCVLTVAAAALIPAVAGCEAGDGAPTLNWHYPTDGAGTVVHGISIRNVFVLGAPNSGALPAGHSAGLYLALVNNGNADKLTSIQAPGTATSVSLPSGGVTLNRNHVALLSGPTPKILLKGLTRTLTSGSAVTIVLTFQHAGQVRLRVPVLSRSQAYATFSAAPAPVPTPSTSPQGTKSPKPSTSPNPGGSASTSTSPGT